MKLNDREIAKELKERLSKIVNLLDFRVFGSRARGDADEHSDMSNSKCVFWTETADSVG